jgi:hypothetical protein
MPSEQFLILRDQAGALYELPLSTLHGARVTAERQGQIEAALSRSAEEQEVQGYDYNTIVPPSDPGGSAVTPQAAGGLVGGIEGAGAVVAAVTVVGVNVGGVVGAAISFTRPPF